MTIRRDTAGTALDPKLHANNMLDDAEILINQSEHLRGISTSEGNRAFFEMRYQAAKRVLLATQLDAAATTIRKP
ncbi:MAG TPA: hypothetical protein VJ890_11870 [Vineibacter sp.]|nr:hypothetical protein [Vineibacter sp.]